MLDIQFIKENKALVQKAISDKNVKSVDLDELIKLNEDRVKLVGEIEQLNQLKKEYANTRDEEKGKEVKVKLKEKEAEFSSIKSKFLNLMSQIPNIPFPDVPVGKDDTENVVVKEVGEKKTFNFKPKPHWEIGEELDLIDSKRGAKVSGSRFVYLKGDAVKLQFAIINFVLSVVTDSNKLKGILDKEGISLSDKPFVPLLTPDMVRSEILFGTARLEPKEDKFFLEKDNLFLVGSSEHAMVSMHSDEIIDEKDLPIRYIGYSTCFRREAGSYGKDTKGILRQHQFDKLEFESFTTPETSSDEQSFLVAVQEYLVQQLELPYRMVSVCTGDMGKPNQKQIDIEVWMPGQEEYKETHSADLIGGYQARRLGIKVKRGDGTKEVLHTNDATAFAMGRTISGILENYQREDGGVEVPKVLVPYVGKEVIRKDDNT